MNFTLAAEAEWPEGLADANQGRGPGEEAREPWRICRVCFQEVLALEAKRSRDIGEGGGSVVLPVERLRPQSYTEANDCDIGGTTAALDELNYFEEQVLSPVQPMVRVYTLHSTGQTELIGHVANWAQRGPQWVREIPVRAGDIPVLLVRRCPRDPNRKPRVPFIARRALMKRALADLLGEGSGPGHEGFAPGGLVPEGFAGAALVNEKNFLDYRDDGAEPAGLATEELEQREAVRVDRATFTRWVSLEHVLPLATLVRTWLEGGAQTASPGHDASVVHGRGGGIFGPSEDPGLSWEEEEPDALSGASGEDWENGPCPWEEQATSGVEADLSGGEDAGVGVGGRITIQTQLRRRNMPNPRDEVLHVVEPIELRHGGLVRACQPLDVDWHRHLELPFPTPPHSVLGRRRSHLPTPKHLLGYGIIFVLAQVGRHRVHTFPPCTRLLGGVGSTARSVLDEAHTFAA